MGLIVCDSCFLFFYLLFFFFKQKTAYEMRISDWSSDVCSSDLLLFPQIEGAASQVPALGVGLAIVDWRIVDLERRLIAAVRDVLLRLLNRIVAGVVVSVMVDFASPVGHPHGSIRASASAVLDHARHPLPHTAPIIHLARRM